ncbi:Type i inositol-3,4-bisphosphate 4-phosphatase, partial [Globisporangium splendens]
MDASSSAPRRSRRRCHAPTAHLRAFLMLLIVVFVCHFPTSTTATATSTATIRREPITVPSSGDGYQDDAPPATPLIGGDANAQGGDAVDPADIDDGLVFLPRPALPVEMFCVSVYLALAIVAACKALSLPTRFSAYEVKRRHTFQRLMTIFALTRTISFLASGIARDLLNRAALCFFFSLMLFQVLFWIDIANPKISSRSKRIWYAFVISNGVFYALVLGLSVLHACTMYSNGQWEENSDEQPQTELLTGVLPVFLIATGSLASSLGLVYSTCKMRRRVGRVLKQSGDGQRRRLDERVEAKLHRALRFTNFVMTICSVTFLLRTILYIQRPFSHRGCGDIRDPNICIIVGYTVPEVLPCVLFLILMWEVEPDMQFPSRRRPSFNSGLTSEATPLLYDGQSPLVITTKLQTNGTPGANSMARSSNSPAAAGAIGAARGGYRVSNRRSSPLSSGLGGNVLEQARRRLELVSKKEQDAKTGWAAHHAPVLHDTRLVSSSDRIRDINSAARKKRSASAYAAMTSTQSDAEETTAYAWLSFQCFNLKLPSSAGSASSFLVLHILDPDTGGVVVEIGRSEVSASEDPCFHLMLPVEMREQDLLRISVYSIRNVNSIDDLKSQWLVGDALIPLVSFMTASKFAFGRATLHALFSPLSRSRSSGEIVVRCEAEVKCASGVADEGRQRITRSFMYFSADDSDEAHGIAPKDSNALSAMVRRKSEVASFHCSHAKVLVEEELIESVYTWEIPYQLLQLILSDLLIKLEALKRENLSDNVSESLSSTPVSQISSIGNSNLPPPMSSSPGALSVVPENEAGDHSDSSEEDGHGFDEADEVAAHAAVNELPPEHRRRSIPSIGMLSEMIFQIQDDAMERKKRKWRQDLIITMEQYISQVEDAILRYGDTNHDGLTFKPSTMKADAKLSFLALNLHQQLMTVGTAVPTSADDVIYGDDSSGARYARLVNTFVGTFLSSPSHKGRGSNNEDHIATIHDLDDENHNHYDGSADSDGESDENLRQRVGAEGEIPVEPVEALRRRVISFDSAENIVNMSASGREVAVTDEQRKLAETIVALGISEKDLHGLHSGNGSDETASEAGSNDQRYPRSKTSSGQQKPQGIAEWVKRKWREVEETHQAHTESHAKPFQHHRMYGTTTVGAFAAHIYGFKNGGIRQMREELERIHGQLLIEAEKSSSDLTLEALERKYHELKWHIERRLEVAFCQAMSALVTCFQQTLYAHIHDDVQFGAHSMQIRGIDYLEMISQAGFLFSVESLLSTYSNEAGMLGDMEAAVKELSRVLIKLRPVQTPREADFRVSVTSGPLGIVIELPIIVCDPNKYPDRNMHRIPGQDAFTGAVYCPLTSNEQIDRAKRVFHRTISVKSILFSQGMNEMQTVANTVGKDSLQKEINAENVVVLENYFNSFVRWCKKQTRASQSSEHSPDVYVMEDLNRLQLLLDRLKTNVQLSGRSKRMAILSLSSLLARSIGGGRVTCCKSAKDRTAMSITLEEANLLVLSHGLHSDERDLFTSLLRTHGVRRENARKNIGKAQYCFSALQNYMLPHDYKCPPGTGGGSRSFS